ncbi:hypothetical protein [Candidatus Odyssella thessalonicensis]|uniref:hypothetical protein n=1 Tax=Candidatus Odyssella thessalonicensis TaxID=84647 RepID=UPI000225A945|nr:hypothetical protein [Candidatus Odyssella thessalonicensis]
MDAPSIFYATLSFIGVLFFMIGSLYGLRWILNKANIKLYPIQATDFHIIDRLPLDNKHQIIRLCDKNFIYVILMGETSLLLDKSDRLDGSCQ